MKKRWITVLSAVALVIFVPFFLFGVCIRNFYNGDYDYAVIKSPDGRYTLKVHLETLKEADYFQCMTGTLYFNTQDREPVEVYGSYYWEEDEKEINVAWIDDTTFQIGDFKESVLNYTTLRKENLPPVEHNTQ